MANKKSSRLSKPIPAKRAAGVLRVGSEQRRQQSGLRCDERLRSKAAFTRVFNQGTRVDGVWFVLLGLPNQLGFSRMGLAVGRRVGRAVQRNRAKRLLREAFRRNKPRAGLDLVLVAKPNLPGRTAREVESEYRSRLSRLRTSAGRSPRTPAARGD